MATDPVLMTVDLGACVESICVDPRACELTTKGRPILGWPHTEQEAGKHTGKHRVPRGSGRMYRKDEAAEHYLRRAAEADPANDQTSV